MSACTKIIEPNLNSKGRQTFKSYLLLTLYFKKEVCIISIMGSQTVKELPHADIFKQTLAGYRSHFSSSETSGKTWNKNKNLILKDVKMVYILLDIWKNIVIWYF